MTKIQVTGTGAKPHRNRSGTAPEPEITSIWSCAILYKGVIVFGFLCKKWTCKGQHFERLKMVKDILAIISAPPDRIIVIDYCSFHNSLSKAFWRFFFFAISSW